MAKRRHRDNAPASRQVVALDGKTAEAIRKIVREDGAADQSIQSRARVAPWVFFGHSMFFGPWQQTKESDVPPWGYAGRDLALQTFFYLPGNEYVQSAESVMQQKVQSTDYTIDGPDRTANRVKDLLNSAEFGRGFHEFVAHFLRSYDTFDNGAFIELIGEGDPDGPLDGWPIGIATIDPLRCRRTNDPDYPVIYQGSDGNHRLHRSRVWFAADMPSADERLLSYGFCALSRAVSMAQTQIMWATMRNEQLDARFPSGLLVMNNVNLEYWQGLVAQHQLEQQAQDHSVFSDIMPVPSMDPQQKVEIQHIPFRQIWEGFDQSELHDLSVDITAMAWGLDHQDLAPLTSGSMGSAAQSTVLDQKARGKGFGNRLQIIEGFINAITPASVTFKFDMTDDAQDLQQAQIRQTKAATIISLYSAQQQPQPNFLGTVQTTLGTTSLITREEGRQILAKEIPEWDEVINPAPDDLTEGPSVQFAGVQAQKQLEWYGPRVRIRKDGAVRLVQERRQKAMPLVPEVTPDEIKRAREALAAMGITFNEVPNA